jgi:hypothetical protein
MALTTGVAAYLLEHRALHHRALKGMAFSSSGLSLSLLVFGTFGVIQRLTA